ncbi:unnamed protein product [Didymodactylos carnosus]|uniref:Uncharacterized protein n=1 Tax=Didymodactylos carnosus TaxID=1234261 RepID=A0A815Q0A4_9BILA|nr:unnamed protein product [Didymodactylos carnosus]CAF4327553.1 unnamed protein product [Didymodactylos carnosus]
MNNLALTFLANAAYTLTILLNGTNNTYISINSGTTHSWSGSLTIDFVGVPVFSIEGNAYINIGQLMERLEDTFISFIISAIIQNQETITSQLVHLTVFCNCETEIDMRCIEDNSSIDENATLSTTLNQIQMNHEKKLNNFRYLLSNDVGLPTDIIYFIYSEDKVATPLTSLLLKRMTELSLEARPIRIGELLSTECVSELMPARYQ